MARDIYVGIDPGLTGAVAIIWPTGTAGLWDTPTIVRSDPRKIRRECNAAQMVDILRPLADGAVAAIEQVHSMPKQGAASTFTFGTGYGTWLGILAALGIPYDRVTPRTWQKAVMGSVPPGKGASVAVALQLFPELAGCLTLKKHEGRADALLIAEWRRRQG